MKPSQNSCFKVHYKRCNHPQLSLSTLYKSLYKQKNLKNLMFNEIAQSTVKVCQWDLLKATPFVKHPVQSKAIMKTYAKSIAKIYQIWNSSLTGQFLDWHFPEDRPTNDTSAMNNPPTDTSPSGLFSDQTFSRRRFPRLYMSPIIMHYCNFPFLYIFVKLQVLYRTRETDFDLQPTNVIYAQCKAYITNDTERLHIKILR